MKGRNTGYTHKTLTKSGLFDGSHSQAIFKSPKFLVMYFVASNTEFENVITKLLSREACSNCNVIIFIHTKAAHLGNINFQDQEASDHDYEKVQHITKYLTTIIFTPKFSRKKIPIQDLDKIRHKSV